MLSFFDSCFCGHKHHREQLNLDEVTAAGEKLKEKFDKRKLCSPENIMGQSMDSIRGSIPQPQSEVLSSPSPGSGSYRSPSGTRSPKEQARLMELEAYRVYDQHQEALANLEGRPPTLHRVAQPSHHKASLAEAERYGQGLAEQQRGQALAAVPLERVVMLPFPPAVMSNVNRIYDTIGRRLSGMVANSNLDNLNDEFQIPEPDKFSLYTQPDILDDTTLDLSPIPTQERGAAIELGIEKQSILGAGIDQNELTKVLSKLALAEEVVPTVMTRTPPAGEVDSVVNTMAEQESTSRPRHGSTVTPDEDILYIGRVRNPESAVNAQQLLLHVQRLRDMHAARWNPPVDHSQQANVRFPEGPYGMLEKERHNGSADIRTRRLSTQSLQQGEINNARNVQTCHPSGPRLLPIPQPGVHSDLSQTINITTPKAQVTSPGLQYSQSWTPGELLNPSVSIPRSKTIEHQPRGKIICEKCDLDYEGFRAYRDHICCEICKDDFPIVELYNAHIKGPKHEARRLRFDHCPACNISAQPIGFLNHMASKAHQKRVRELQIKTGEVYVPGGGNEIYGSRKRSGGQYIPLPSSSAMSLIFSRTSSMASSRSLRSIDSALAASPDNLRPKLMRTGSSSPIASYSDSTPHPQSHGNDRDSLPSQQAFQQQLIDRHGRQLPDSSPSPDSYSPRSFSDGSLVSRGLVPSSSDSFLQTPTWNQNAVAERTMRRASGNLFTGQSGRGANVRSPLFETTNSDMLANYRPQSIPDDSVLLHVDMDDTTIRPGSSISNIESEYSVIEPYMGTENLCMSYESGGSQTFSARHPAAEQVCRPQRSTRMAEPMPSLGYGGDFSQCRSSNPRQLTSMGPLPHPPIENRLVVVRPYLHRDVSNRSVGPLLTPPAGQNEQQRYEPQIATGREEATEEEQEDSINDSQMSIILPPRSSSLSLPRRRG